MESCPTRTVEASLRVCTVCVHTASAVVNCTLIDICTHTDRIVTAMTRKQAHFTAHR